MLKIARTDGTRPAAPCLSLGRLAPRRRCTGTTLFYFDDDSSFVTYDDSGQYTAIEYGGENSFDTRDGVREQKLHQQRHSRSASRSNYVGVRSNNAAFKFIWYDLLSTRRF